MKRAIVGVALVLLIATDAYAQRGRHRPSPPPAPFVPQTLSTGGITTLPAPPPPGPFDARPGTYAPRYNRPGRSYPGGGFVGIPYNNGLVEYVPSSSEVAAPPGPPAAPVAEPPRAPAPIPAPPRAVVAHGPDTFYVIAGCYAGNHPPNPARLPKNCDLTKLRTLPIR
jgi:hypothetical protein